MPRQPPKVLTVRALNRALLERGELAVDEVLEALLVERRAVRMVLMRGTLHLVTVRDALQFRPVVQAWLDRALYTASPFGRKGTPPGTVLVDGFIAAKWKLARGKKKAALQIQPFRKLSAAERNEVLEEGERFVAFFAREEDRELQLSPPPATRRPAPASR